VRKQRPTKREKELDAKLGEALASQRGLHAMMAGERLKYEAQLKAQAEKLQERRISMVGQLVQAYADSQKALGMTLATLLGQQPW
jgi:hypothetical protein